MKRAEFRIEDVSKRFGDVQSLRQVSLTVGEDELVVVLGPTGAGKTTLLRIIAGLETPDHGSIHGATREITHDSPRERDVALVFQNFSLYPDFTVRKNLEFPLQAPGRGLSREQIEARVRWAADILRITPLLERRAARLSGGEMQRVAIGRAIVRRPRLFLMDEPLTNLDAKLREELRSEIVGLRRELGAPMLYVTHDQSEALSMADRVVVLEQGSVLQSGTPREVYERPATPVVARQLGQPSINIISVRRDGDWFVSERGLTLAPAQGALETALVGIRPEHVMLSGGSQSATVQLVEDIGPVKTVVLDFMGERVRALVPKGAAVRVGDSLKPTIDARRTIVWR